MHHYFEKVCLLQIATESLLVMDPLALKIFPLYIPFSPIPHPQDIPRGGLRCSFPVPDFGFEVENLFDTQSACKISGLPGERLGSAAAKPVPCELNKKYQRADWSQRPLSRRWWNTQQWTRYLIPWPVCWKKNWKRRPILLVEEECLFLSKVRSCPPGMPAY